MSTRPFSMVYRPFRGADRTRQNGLLSLKIKVRSMKSQNIRVVLTSCMVPCCYHASDMATILWPIPDGVIRLES